MLVLWRQTDQRASSSNQVTNSCCNTEPCTRIRLSCNSLFRTFWLDMHAVFATIAVCRAGFGVGGMILDGLLFGQYIDSHCGVTLSEIIRPATQLVFTFLQMYFIFRNSKVILFAQPGDHFAKSLSLDYAPYCMSAASSAASGSSCKGRDATSRI